MAAHLPGSPSFTPHLSEPQPRDRWVDMGTDSSGAPSQPATQPASHSFSPGKKKALMLETTGSITHTHMHALKKTLVGSLIPQHGISYQGIP